MDNLFEIKNIANVEIDSHTFIKPEYLNHSNISGNKLRKLKYNLFKAKTEKHSTLLTFGGAFSNHIAAVAHAGYEYGFKTIGVIRGEELEDNFNDNPSLIEAKKKGMRFKFVTRSTYRKKATEDYLQSLQEEFGDFYLIPEGGTNELAVKGCEEILNEDDFHFDYVCCPVGTGGTIAGIINSSKMHQKILGFPALKDDFLSDEISKFATQNNWSLIKEYHFGGYAKINKGLVEFINTFKKSNGIPLDPIYTGKMMYGIFDLLKNNYFSEGSKILAIHTGGLQGIEGMNNYLKRRKLPLIS